MRSTARRTTKGSQGSERIPDIGRCQIHGTAVELSGQAVLMRGPSGSGKSDLALRLIDAGARLIADDRCDLTLENEGITVSPPEKLAGLLEVRGVGVIELPHVAVARLGLVVDLVGRGHMQRLPAQKQCSFLGVEVPLIALTPFEPSAPSKIRLLARRLARIPTALS